MRVFKLRKVKYLKQKKKLLMFGFVLIVGLFLSFSLFRKAFASYHSSVKLNANIDQALYLFGGDRLTFNIDPGKISPEAGTKNYRFSIANYNSKEQSDLDIEYTIAVRSTTNLPIVLSMYRNNESTDMLGSFEYKQDVDGSWYRVYNVSKTYRMNYNEKIKDIYTLQILFPSQYANDTTYAESIENIEITLNSKQVVG